MPGRSQAREWIVARVPVESMFRPSPTEDRFGNGFGAHFDICLLPCRKPSLAWRLSIPPTEPTIPQGALGAPLTAIFALRALEKRSDHASDCGKPSVPKQNGFTIPRGDETHADAVMRQELAAGYEAEGFCYCAITF
jgi:hypothetical protein